MSHMYYNLLNGLMKKDKKQGFTEHLIDVSGMILINLIIS